MPVPGSPRDVHVNVILNSEKPGDFRIEPEPPGSLPIGPNGELIFRNEGHSGFFIYFDLKDPNKLGYQFPANDKMNEAVWSKLGSGECPTTGTWEIFDPRSVTNKGMTLRVRNTNVGSEVGKFGYTLRVTKDGGASYLPLDPGGDNRNGPTSGVKLSSAMVFVGGVIAGSLATLGTQALLQG